MGILVVKKAAACMELSQDRVQDVGFCIGGVEHSSFASRVRNYSSDVFFKLHTYISLTEQTFLLLDKT
jgi:hypothetical protein